MTETTQTTRYHLPNFNLVYSVWRRNTPVQAPPDGEGKCQLRFGWAGSVVGATATVNRTTVAPAGMQGIPTVLLFPRGSDLRDSFSATGGPWDGDTAEVPKGSKRYYIIYHLEYMYPGFPNEHLAAQTLPCYSPPPPMPPPPIYQGED